MSMRFNLSIGNKKCRLCLRKTEAYIDLFQGSFQQMILELTSLKISEDDGYPKIACINCIDEVQQANNTRKRILECYNKLQELKNVKMEQSHQDLNLNYPEVVILDEFSNDIADVDEVSQGASSPGIGDILSGYGDYVEEEDENQLHDFDVKAEMITESSDLTYGYHNPVKSDIESDVVNKVKEKKIQSNNSEPQIILPRKHAHNQFDESMLEAIKGVFSMKERRKTKRQLEQEKKNFICAECNLEFKNNKYAYYLHMLKHKKSQCKICGILIRTDNMSKHVECHTSGPRVCDLCGTTCKNIESLRGHIFYMHRKTADQYKCDQCDRSFRMKYKLELHKKKEHIGIRGHICSTCKKGFFTLRDMNHHIKMTHLKLRPHVCPHCERGFSSKYALKTHVRQHTNETPYKCYICAEGFRQNVSLRTHLKSKHNIEEVKNFPCEFCDKAFSTEFALKVHLRLHSDDNYKCEHCEECFQQKIFLVNHLKSVHEISDASLETLICINENDIDQDVIHDGDQFDT